MQEIKAQLCDAWAEFWAIITEKNDKLVQLVEFAISEIHYSHMDKFFDCPLAGMAGHYARLLGIRMPGASVMYLGSTVHRMVETGCSVDAAIEHVKATTTEAEMFREIPEPTFKTDAYLMAMKYRQKWDGYDRDCGTLHEVKFTLPIDVHSKYVGTIDILQQALIDEALAMQANGESTRNVYCVEDLKTHGKMRYSMDPNQLWMYGHWVSRQFGLQEFGIRYRQLARPCTTKKDGYDVPEKHDQTAVYDEQSGRLAIAWVEGYRKLVMGGDYHPFWKSKWNVCNYCNWNCGACPFARQEYDAEAA